MAKQIPCDIDEAKMNWLQLHFMSPVFFFYNYLIRRHNAIITIVEFNEIGHFCAIENP